MKICVRGAALGIAASTVMFSFASAQRPEIRDLLASGTNTALITTGGIEENGPRLTTGKHNHVLKVMGDAGDAIEHDRRLVEYRAEFAVEAIHALTNAAR